MPVVVIPSRRRPPSLPAPFEAPQTPDTQGFIDALERKRQMLGSDVIFYQPEVVTFPAGTALDEAGEPLDPRIHATSSAQASATVRCGVFFKAVNRGGAAGADIDSAIGFDEKTRIFCIAPAAAASAIDGASELEFHSDRFKVTAIKRDEVIGGYRRILVYGAAE